MENKKFWGIIFLISLFVSFLVYYEEFQTNTVDLAVASILGYTFGAIIFPAILALIVGGFYKLFRKEFDRSSFRATFLTAWIIILSLSFLGIFFGERTTSNQTGSNENYIYEPTDNEYSVSFVNQPEISENIFLGTSLISETAELTLPDALSMLRAESVAYTDEIDGRFVDEETIKSILDAYINANGLSHSELRFEHSSLGKKVKVTAFKTLKDSDSNDINVTYGIEAYFGDHSGMFLTGASVSSSYPTPEIIDFFNSIYRKDIDPRSNTNQSISYNSNDLFSATEEGDLNSLIQILSSGIDIHTEDENGNTALHVAATMGYYEICKYLIENGADVNYRGLYDGVALADVAARGYNDIVKLLIENNADVNAQGTYGASPLSLAISLGQYQTSMILLENGADPDLTDITGETPRSLANEKSGNRWRQLFN